MQYQYLLHELFCWYVLNLEIMINGKPEKIMHDNGKQFRSKIFKRFLEYNNIKDKPIPNSYPQLQGKIEACNKIVKNEFISVQVHIKHR